MTDRTLLQDRKQAASGSAMSMRADLVRRRVWMGDQPVWVVKDPLSRAFFYFNDQEYEILGLADGQRSVSEIASECAKRFAPQYVSAESLVRFFADARENGLLVVDGLPLPNGNSRDETGRRWWHNPLAIRLPGLNPDRFLDSILPLVKPLFSSATLLLALLLMLVAAGIAARDFDALAQHLSAAATRLGNASSFVTLLLVVSLTKMIHELAHALACKHFGGECRELGVMFLVGVPCLYCDVSDAWMLEQRWKRILISSAGMLAELTLASIATILWLFTVDGPVRDVCVTLMVVCSVSTVMFNGNPLLRYDGYYILSDLVGIPNLAGQSTAMIRSWFRRLLWATPTPRWSQSVSRRTVFVVGYGVVSGLYRALIYMFILLMIYRVAESYELGGPVGLLVLLAMIGFCFRWAKAVLTPPDRSARRASMSTQRPALIVGGVGIMGVLLSLIPLPRSVIAPMSIQPAGAQTVFVTNEGAITEALLNGAEVKTGQSIAVLRNPGIDRELSALDALCERLAAQLESLRQRRSSNRELSSQIPVVEKALAEAVKRKRLRQQVAGHLTLTSPRHGQVFAPPSRLPKTADDRLPQFWIGTPLEPMNRGAWLQEGTVVCVVGDQSAREAILLMRQQDIELVRPNQSVTLLLADRSRGVATGKVLEVAATPSREIPAELERVGLTDSGTVSTPESPMYQVRVALDPTSTTLPVRLTGAARITVSHASILTRVSRFLRDSFG